MWSSNSVSLSPYLTCPPSVLVCMFLTLNVSSLLMHLSILSVYLLYICMSARPSVCQFTHLSIISICLSIYLFICFSICLSICQPIVLCLPVFPSICPLSYLSVAPFPSAIVDDFSRCSGPGSRSTTPAVSTTCTACQASISLNIFFLRHQTYGQIS